MSRIDSLNPLATGTQNFAIVLVSGSQGCPGWQGWETDFIDWCSRYDTAIRLAEITLIDNSAVAIVDLRNDREAIIQRPWSEREAIVWKSRGWLPIDVEGRILRAAAKLRSLVAKS
ncbi:MAG: hypothetical protein PHU85_00110 [Phycisphaerae bacterium]|nr:hypothetical protein [Phycisphaerae bacterium]